MEDIIRMVGILNEKVLEALPSVQDEVRIIINGKVVSIPQIERTLDTLLNFAHLGHGITEFRQLNDYYQTVHPENSKHYDRIFSEMLE